jgi:hypothetical protein
MEVKVVGAWHVHVHVRRRALFIKTTHATTPAWSFTPSRLFPTSEIPSMEENAPSALNIQPRKVHSKEEVVFPCLDIAPQQLGNKL